MLQTHTQNNFVNEYTPDIVSAPGDTLQEILETRGMTQTEFAERLGLTHKTVNEIIRGKAPISYDTAIALENVLGIPAAFWNSYEALYRNSLARLQEASRLHEQIAWLNKIPWKSAVKLGWISIRPTAVEQMLEILRFLGVASPKQYEEVYGHFAVQWRRVKDTPIDQGAVSFWLRQGEIKAAELAKNPRIVFDDYNPKEFEKKLVSIRALTRDRNPETFVPELQRICAFAGVAVVFVPEITGTRAGGVARWLSPTRALIQLSLRYKTNDLLWFNFYHEAAHILKHSKKNVFLEFDGNDKNQEEEEAEEYSQNMLIPFADYNTLLKQGKPTKASVEAFAEQIGIDPGIVVGRLQHERIIERNWFNDLKQRYTWE